MNDPGVRAGSVRGRGCVELTTGSMSRTRSIAESPSGVGLGLRPLVVPAVPIR
jgi:hypothetical protein